MAFGGIVAGIMGLFEKSERGGLYVEVAFGLPLVNTFSYVVPEELRDLVAAGKRVEAPFGPRRMAGYCVGVSHRRPDADFELKAVLSIIDPEPLLDSHMLELTRWVGETYFAGWGEALEAALPAGVRYKVGDREVMFLASGRDEALEAAHGWEKRAAKRARALLALIENDGRLSVRELSELAAVSTSTARGLLKAGVAKLGSIPAGRARARRDPPVREYTRGFDLSREQKLAMERIGAAIEGGGFAPFLLYGVTGSGKTEVYLQAIEKVVRAGGQAIVLVPEISLTPQTVSRFRARFPNIAVLHSHLAAGKRHKEWRAIQSGRADVVIGARSAIFAPAGRLGLVVIDEEHENTFKQETSPRYSARDVALERGRMLGIPVILGSATPSLESFHAAQRGAIERIDLPFRVEGRPLPPVEIVDMRAERREHKTFTIISQRLVYWMKRALAEKEQVILFLNRRGFATHLLCRRCGWVGKCPNCDITLTFHRSRDLVECHYCDYKAKPPMECPDCGYKNVRFFGVGTERIVEEAATQFPEARIARMDSDTMKTRNAYVKALGDFRRGLTDILVGTQMIAKGLDFPNVTVVGVVSADVSLNLPDFRARERTFDLLSQVAGRTGRGAKGGMVVVQTLTPEQFAIRTAARHDYLSFATEELEHRGAMGYPPQWRLARIVLRGRKREKVEAQAGKIRKALDEAAAERVEVLGPTPAVISRLQGRYRYNLIVKAPDTAALHTTLEGARKLVKAGGTVQGIIDVDPLSML